MPNIGFWAAAGAGGGAAGAYELISSTILTSTASSVTFSSIPSTYKHLQIRMVARSNTSNYSDVIALRFNSDTSTTYSEHYLEGDGSTVSSSGYANRTSIRLFDIADSLAASGVFGSGIVDVLDYANTSKYKTAKALGGFTEIGKKIGLRSGSWRSLNAIDTINLLPYAGTLFAVGSRFSLYGIKG